MKFLQDILQVHAGLLTVAALFISLAAVGWACDEWEKRKEP